MAVPDGNNGAFEWKRAAIFPPQFCSFVTNPSLHDCTEDGVAGTSLGARQGSEIFADGVLNRQTSERFECQIHELYAACRISNDYGVMAVVDSATQIQKRLRGLLRRRVLIACGPVIRGLHLHPGVSTVTSDAVDVGFSAPTPPIPLVTAAKFRFESSQYWEEAG